MQDAHFPISRGPYDWTFFPFSFSFLHSTFVKHLEYVKLMIDTGGTKVNITESREVFCRLIGTRQIQMDESKYHIKYTLLTTEEQPHLCDCCPQTKHTIVYNGDSESKHAVHWPVWAPVIPTLFLRLRPI